MCHKSPFSSSLTTTVFSQRSMRRFGASPRRAAPKGQPSSLVQHRIKNPYLHAGLLSAFVTHGAARLKGRRDVVAAVDFAAWPSLNCSLSAGAPTFIPCLLYTSDAADDLLCVDL